MGTVAHAHQDRANLKPATFHFQRVAYRTGCIRVGKDQYVRWAIKTGGWEQAATHLGIKGRVHVHFAFIGKVARGSVEDAKCTTRTRAAVSAVIAELRIRTHCDFRLDTKSAHMSRCGANGFGDLFGAGACCAHGCQQ